MSSVFEADLGSILDNYADVIEGGNTWRGSGTAHNGIPGRYPTDRFLRDSVDNQMTVVGSSVSTTTFDVVNNSSHAWTEGRWVDTGAPAFYATCSTSGGTTTILNETRKITGWNNTTKVFTIAPALTAAPIANDVFDIRQGYKRVANANDINTPEPEGSPEGWDRFFHLTANSGVELRWYGDGYKVYQTEMVLMLRLGKYGRLHDWTAALMTDLSIIRSVITRQTLYPSYVKALYADEDQEASVVVDDQNKVVVADPYTLVYSFDATYK